jgi:hypothetical protein
MGYSGPAFYIIESEENHLGVILFLMRHIWSGNKHKLSSTLNEKCHHLVASVSRELDQEMNRKDHELKDKRRHPQ